MIVLKNCATCKFMNFRCKGECGDCVNKFANGSSNAECGVRNAEWTTPQSASRQLPLHRGAFYKEEVEEKCKCIECYDEDSGKYKYWVGAPELVKYFEGVMG